MVKSGAAIVINRRILRPSGDLIEQLRNTPSTNIVHAMNSAGALDYRIKPVGTHAQFIGTALTIHAGPRDNLAVWAALEVALPGDVLSSRPENTWLTRSLVITLLPWRRTAGALPF